MSQSPVGGKPVSHHQDRTGTPVLAEIRWQFLEQLEASGLYEELIAPRLLGQLRRCQTHPGEMGDYSPLRMLEYFVERCSDYEESSGVGGQVLDILSAIKADGPVGPIPFEVFRHLLGFTIVRKSDAFSEFYYADIDSAVLSDQTKSFLKGSVWAPAELDETVGQSSSIARTLTSGAMCAPDTFADPRGTVACEDLIQGNYSFISYLVPAPRIELGVSEPKVADILVTMYWPLSHAFWFGDEVNHDSLADSYPLPKPGEQKPERWPRNEFDILRDVVNANAHAIRYWCALEDRRIAQGRFRHLLAQADQTGAGSDDRQLDDRILKALVSDETDGDPVGAVLGIHYEVLHQDGERWMVRPTKLAACREFLEHRLCTYDQKAMREFLKRPLCPDEPHSGADCVIPGPHEASAFARFHVYFPQPQDSLTCADWCRNASDELREHSCRLTELVGTAWGYYKTFRPEMVALSRRPLSELQAMEPRLVPAKIVAGAIETLLQQVATALAWDKGWRKAETVRQAIDTRIGLAVAAAARFVPGMAEGQVVADLKALIDGWRDAKRPQSPLAVTGHLHIPRESQECGAVDDDRWWSTKRVALVINNRGLDHFLDAKVAGDASPAEVEAIVGASGEVESYRVVDGDLAGQCHELLGQTRIDVMERVCLPIDIRTSEGTAVTTDTVAFVSLWSSRNFSFDRDLLDLVVLEAENRLTAVLAEQVRGEYNVAQLRTSIIHELKNELAMISILIEKGINDNDGTALRRARFRCETLLASSRALYSLSSGSPSFDAIERTLPLVFGWCIANVDLQLKWKSETDWHRNYGNDLANATLYLPPEYRDCQEPAEGQIDDVLLFILVKNLVSDCWKYHRKRWRRITTGLAGGPAIDQWSSPPQFDVHDPLEVHLKQDHLGWTLTLRNAAIPPAATFERSFLEIGGSHATGLVTPNTPFWSYFENHGSVSRLEPDKLSTDTQDFLKGSAVAQMLAKRYGLTLSARADVGDAGNVTGTILELKQG